MATNNPAQNFISVRDIRDNIVIQKDGKMTMIILASSINFALKSYDEQTAILQQFQSFLNTIDFSLQIYMQSRRLNINPYLELLTTLEEKQDNDLMRIQLREYVSFIKNFTTEVDVMNKNFFLAVSYTSTKANLGSSITSLFGGGGEAKLPNDIEYERARTQLEQRTSLVVDGLARLGVRTITLGKDELVELFYHIYNPGDRAGSAPITDTM